MEQESKKQKELKEIFLHIENLVDEKNQNQLEPIDIIKNKTDIIAGENEITQISQDSDKDKNENFLTMKIDSDSIGTCDICKNKIMLEKNLSGLVIHGKFFACEKCCQDASKDDLTNWAETRIAKPEDVKPIALWLMQEKNKTRLF